MGRAYLLFSPIPRKRIRSIPCGRLWGNGTSADVRPPRPDHGVVCGAFLLLSRTTKLFLPSLHPSFLPSSPSPPLFLSRKTHKLGGGQIEEEGVGKRNPHWLWTSYFFPKSVRTAKEPVVPSSLLLLSPHSVRFSSPLIERRLPLSLSFLLHPAGRPAKQTDGCRLVGVPFAIYYQGSREEEEREIGTLGERAGMGWSERRPRESGNSNLCGAK